MGQSSDHDERSLLGWVSQDELTCLDDRGLTVVSAVGLSVVAHRSWLSDIPVRRSKRGQTGRGVVYVDPYQDPYE